MRYLRMLSNSVIAGALASGYLTALVLQLNPEFALEATALLSLAVTLGLAYGTNLAVVFYAAIVLRQVVATEVLSPGWLSVRLLSWLCTAAAGGGAAIMWLNARGFEPVLDEESARRMTAGAAIVSAAAGVFLLLALAHLGRRGGRLSAAVLLLTMAGSVAGPIAVRGGARVAALPPPAPALALKARPEARVTMLLLDGASLDMISPAAAAGQLPNFGRVQDSGAVMHVATLRPTQAEPAWSAVATARAPVENGVRSAALYRMRSNGQPIAVLPDYCFAQALVRFGFLAEEPHTSASLRARTLWSIVGEAGVSVGIVGWPLTFPATPVNGYLIADAFHQLSETELDLSGAAAVWPPSLLPVVREATLVPAEPDPAEIARLPSGAAGGDAEARRDPEPVLADRMHLQILRALDATTPVAFRAVRLPGIDAVGHYFLRYANPAAFGDVTDEERRQYAEVLPRYYAFVDGVVGRLSESLGPDDLLLVVSAFGMEPLTPGKRLLEQLVGNAERSGTHERAPDGFLMAYGPAIAAGRPARASLLDIAPTVLYYLGLPVARDMGGAARTDLFTPEFTASHPITFIPSYGK